MLCHKYAAYVLGVLAAAALLYGCADTGSQRLVQAPSSVVPVSPSLAHYRPMVSPDGVWSVLPAGFKRNSHRPSWMKSPPDFMPEGHEIVAEFGSTDIYRFQKFNRRNAPPTVCEPASSTNGIAVDPSGNLWVPDGKANTTTEYGPDCGPARMTIPDPSGEPADVAFDRSGNIYILNINNHSGSPTVGVYSATGKLLRTLSDPSFSVLFGVGTDHSNNLFVSNLTSNNVGNVVEFAGGAMPGKALAGIALGLPGSPALDSAANLIITDWLALTINVYAPPYTGAPTKSPLLGYAIWCPLGHYEKRLYCGDAQNGSIDVYDYPGGAYEYSYSNALSPDALVTGSAPSPAAPL